MTNNPTPSPYEFETTNGGHSDVHEATERLVEAVNGMHMDTDIPIVEALFTNLLFCGKLSKTRPPEEIFSFFHELEAKGIEIPDLLDKWWKYETDLSVQQENNP